MRRVMDSDFGFWVLSIMSTTEVQSLATNAMASHHYHAFPRQELRTQIVSNQPYSF